jgi:ABC-type multidrug transport system ATPase subunit
MRGSRGWVYRDVDLDVDPARLVAIHGTAGSGRTCLLLTLAGRMAPTEGFARVANLPLPRQMTKVQRIAALGVAAGVSDLDPALTVRDHVRERLLLHGRLARRSRVVAALDAAGLDVDPGRLVRELHPGQRQLLGVAAALIGSPQVVFVDDVDDGLAARGQRELWEALRGVSREGVTVVATCHEAGPAEDVADAVVHLRHPSRIPGEEAIDARA